MGIRTKFDEAVDKIIDTLEIPSGHLIAVTDPEEFMVIVAESVAKLKEECSKSQE